VNTNESETIARDRAARSAWLTERGYRVVEIEAAAVESDLVRVLDGLAVRME
jgi:tRNA/rRNA methyltransferase